MFLAWGILFWSVISEGKCFGFRDSGHYYFRLFAWIQRRWSAGEIPLWNPQENLGTPVLADASSSLFYPGKLLFFLPGFEFTDLYVAYVVGHVALAGIGTYLLVRSLGGTEIGAGLAALAYSLGGPVLTQCSNVIFLVGASWLPFAILACIRLTTSCTLTSSIRLGIVLALMTLGGDPQCAYNVVIAGGVLVFLKRGNQPGSDDASEVSPLLSRMMNWFGTPTYRRMGLLICSAGIGIILSALQVLPSMQWSRQSTRAIFDQPRSLYEISAYLSQSSPGEADIDDVTHGLFGEAKSGTHHAHIYQFSLAPWSLIELVWPNSSGRMVPINQRWINIVPSADRVWYLSIYMGVIPLLMSLTVFSLRSHEVGIKYFSWLIMLFGLASLGWYGPGWIVRELEHAMFGISPESIEMGSPTGGIYWWMVTFLPGYAMFRFPAKLWIIVSLSIAVLGGLGWDRFLFGDRRRFRASLILLSVGSFSLLTATFIFETAILQLFSAAKQDPIFGPLQSLGAVLDLRWGIVHSLILTLILFFIGRYLAHGVNRRLACGWVVLAVTGIELVNANQWVLMLEPRDTWTQPSLAEQRIESVAGDRSSRIRVFRGSANRWQPKQWSASHSIDRMAEVIRWDTDTLYPKHHLSTQFELVESNSSIASSDLETFYRISRKVGVDRKDGIREPPEEILTALSSDVLLLPELELQDGRYELVDAPQRDDLGTLYALPKSGSMDRCWFADTVIVLPIRTNLSQSELDHRTASVLIKDKKPRDFRQETIVESDATLGSMGIEAHAVPHRNRCRIIHRSHQRVAVETICETSDLLVLNDFYDPDWIATLETPQGTDRRQVPILRTNRILRGVVAPPGRHRIIFTYRPVRFWIGSLISICGWIMVAGMLLYPTRHRKRGTCTDQAR